MWIKLAILCLLVTGFLGCKNRLDMMEGTDSELQDRRNRNRGNQRRHSDSHRARRYDGPPVDINMVNMKPPKYDICDQYVNLYNPQPEDIFKMRSCEFGRDEAERMAERFGGGNGRIQGFLRGYAWGMHKMSRLWENNEREISKGADSIHSLRGQMRTGVDQGESIGRSNGESKGHSDAIGRFQSIVNQGVDPDMSVVIPETFYKAEENAYAKYVAVVPTREQILRREINAASNLRVYDSWDSVYLGEKVDYHAWEYWYSDGLHRFEKRRWYDSASSLQIWKRRPMDSKPKYQRLDKEYPGNCTGPIPEGQQFPECNRAGLPRLNLKAIFHNSYKESYGYYVNYYFSSSYHRSLDDGFFAGEQVGKQLGKRIAFYKGVESAFNQEFKRSAEDAYYRSYEDSYRDSFAATFDEYMTTPQLSIKFLKVIGKVNDGIYKAGEAVAAEFNVTNIGGVGSPLTVYLSGEVTNPQQQTLRVPRLASKKLRTDYIATLEETLPARSSARVNLHVNDLPSQAIYNRIQKVMEIRDRRVSVYANDGRARVEISSENVSTIPTPATVKVQLLLNSKNWGEENIGFVGAKQSSHAVFEVKGLDPFELIKGDNRVTLKVFMNEDLMDETSFALQTSDSNYELARYYDLLVSGGGIVPEHVRPEDRLSMVTQYLVGVNLEQARKFGHFRGNTYADRPDQTLLGQLVRVFKSKPQSDQALETYLMLGRQLYTHREHLSWGEKSSYTKMVENFEIVREGEDTRQVSQTD